MSTLQESFGIIREQVPFGDAFLARTYFLAGASAMAEAFAAGQGTVIQLIRELAQIQTQNAQLLASELRKLRNGEKDE